MIKPEIIKLGMLVPGSGCDEARDGEAGDALLELEVLNKGVNCIDSCATAE